MCATTTNTYVAVGRAAVSVAVVCVHLAQKLVKLCKRKRVQKLKILNIYESQYREREISINKSIKKSINQSMNQRNFIKFNFEHFIVKGFSLLYIIIRSNGSTYQK